MNNASVSISAVDQNAVVIVTEENGEPPRALTISELRHFLMGITDDPKLLERVTIIDMVLERIELDLIDPI